VVVAGQRREGEQRLGRDLDVAARRREDAQRRALSFSTSSAMWLGSGVDRPYWPVSTIESVSEASAAKLAFTLGGSVAVSTSIGTTRPAVERRSSAACTAAVARPLT
jgi:hypothetical protein